MIINRIKRLLQPPKTETKIVPDGVRIGKGCEIYKGVSFGSEPYMVTLGDHVRVAAGVVFATHDGGAWVLRNMHLLDDADFFGRIVVGNNVHIGMGSFICPGVTIGDNCIIGARSVVTKSVPGNTVYAGQPAKYIETITEYYDKHKDTCDFTKHMSPEEKKAYLQKKYAIDE